MKRHFKLLLVAFLALTMVLTGAMCVQAKTITKPAQTLTLYPSKSLHYNANRRIFATANETVVNTDSYMNWGTSSFKSSKTSVVSLISRKVYMLTQTNPDSFSAYFMKAKKTGSAVVSYKKGKDTYKQKVTVKKYVNPLSSFKIGSMITSAASARRQAAPWCSLPGDSSGPPGFFRIPRLPRPLTPKPDPPWLR